MINHVRTFIMNTGSNGHGVDEPGEEFIDPMFIPRHLPPGMRAVRHALFGNDGDRLRLNYQMRRIMQIMHASPAAQDLLVKDSRITYLPFKPDLLSTPRDVSSDLASTLSLLENVVNTTALQEIFPTVNTAPYDTWFRIYNESQQAATFRFTALMLAYAERVESLPQERQ